MLDDGAYSDDGAFLGRWVRVGFSMMAIFGRLANAVRMVQAVDDPKDDAFD
jgi:hypothetical protein